MNIYKIALILLIFSSVKITAQYGYGNGYGNGYGGMGRTGMQNNTATQSKPDPELIEKDKTKKINEYMETLQTDLNLDELQFIAIKNELTASRKNVDLILKKEKSEEEKVKDIKASLEKTDNEIITFLNPEQKVKYKELIEERNRPGGSEKTSKSKSKMDKIREKAKKQAE